MKGMLQQGAPGYGAPVTHHCTRGHYNGYVAVGMSFIRSMLVTHHCTWLRAAAWRAETLAR